MSRHIGAVLDLIDAVLNEHGEPIAVTLGKPIADKRDAAAPITYKGRTRHGL
jgi:hypothetical protein